MLGKKEPGGFQCCFDIGHRARPPDTGRRRAPTRLLAANVFKGHWVLSGGVFDGGGSEGQALRMEFRLHTQARGDMPAVQTVWAFVTGRMSLAEFEAWVYECAADVEALFDEDSALALLSMDYRKVSPRVLALDLESAMSALPLLCECPKQAAAQRLFLASVGHNESHLSSTELGLPWSETLEIIRELPELAGPWEDDTSGHGGMRTYLHPGHVERCRRCERLWFTILDETIGDILAVELFEAQGTRAFEALLWKHFRLVRCEG